MEALFIYIAKSGGLLLLFYTAYYFLLRKETFFTRNRWFLLTGLITSVVLPFIVYTKNIWVAPASTQNPDFQPVFTQTIENPLFEINWNYVLLACYGIGFLALLIKFAIDFYSLNAILKGKKVKQQADFKFIDVKENIAPFSYFEYIVYNSSLYTATELENIIEHEKVHSDQNHTVDVLISRIFSILFWFNPLVWLYKKAITQNLEFIADNEAAKKLSDKKAYQYTLLKITTHENCVAITNHFYQSLIKKRIVMLNQNQSKKRNYWKYYTVIPALVAFVLLFQIEVVAHEKEQTQKNSAAEKVKGMDVYEIKKTTTDQELATITEKLKAEHNVDAVISETKRNSNNELTSIKVDLKNGKEETQALHISGSDAIKDCGIIIKTEENGVKKIIVVTKNEFQKDATEGSKIKIKKTQKTNTNTDVKTNTTTGKSDPTNGTTNTHVITTFKTNVNTNVNVSTDGDKNETTSITYYSQSKPKVIVKSGGSSAKQLIIVDGVVLTDGTSMDDIDALDIEKMSVFKGTQAIEKYGDKGKNGVIEITTKK
ncbi:M56 family metallopeptidase [Flavobacterium sp. ABG]|uniref:M56 family metallopeptidase n=1 Tax=Flavobacterium sp. ABG TaxID=1423322 RepID=UPI00064AD193|nr:M56 family metallopeptidase [Flavobacterium sp. ABG]KLT67879.1 peptidase M56 [Flavobacterium sp. ABG]